MSNITPVSLTNQWEFTFEADLEVGGYNLPNRIRIPLPPRGKLFPRRKTQAKFSRVLDGEGRISYRVLLVPEGKDTAWLTKWLLGQAAESLESKVGAIMLGGSVGAILAGLATIFVPSDIATTYAWQEECSEGPVYGVTSGF